MSAWAFIVGLTLGVQAQASEPVVDQAVADPLTVRLRNCRTLSEKRLRELLDLELATVGRAEHPGPIEVRVDCFASSIAISAKQESSGTLDRHIGTRPHLLSDRDVALAASELVAEAWELEESVQQAKTLAKAGEQHEQPPEPPRFPDTFGMTVALQRLGEPNRPQLPLSLFYAHEFSRRWELLIGLGGAFAQTKTNEVVVQERYLTATPELRLKFPLSWGSLFLGAATPSGTVKMRTEVVSGEAQPRDLSAAWSSLVGRLGWTSPRSQRLFLSASGSVGVVTVPVQGEIDGEAAVAFDGLLLGGQAALGFSF